MITWYFLNSFIPKGFVNLTDTAVNSSSAYTKPPLKRDIDASNSAPLYQKDRGDGGGSSTSAWGLQSTAIDAGKGLWDYIPEFQRGGMGSSGSIDGQT